MDNAPNNDTMMKYISIGKLSTLINLYYLCLSLTYLGLITHQSREVKEYDPVHHQVRCQGHIINLAADAFLCHRP